MAWLYRLLGSMLSAFEFITGGYALALLLYALVFKIVFLPFSIKQQKTQIKMAKLQPKINLIKAKYKGRNDQRTMQKQQQEIMELQRQEGANPLSGCLPLLIQLPLIILLFNVITAPLSYIAKPTEAFEDVDKNEIILNVYKEVTDNPEIDALTEIPSRSEIDIISRIYRYVDDGIIVDKDGKEVPIYDVEHNSLVTVEQRIAVIENLGLDYDSIPNFKLFGVNLAVTPNEAGFSLLWLIPVLAALSQWGSMWLTRKFNGTNPMQAQDAQTQASMRIMDLVFPGLTLWMAFSFSGMLGIYWIFQALLGLLQAFILSRVMPLPKYSEDELKAMRKAEKEVEKAQKEAAKTQPKYRSLHYIDDDDYDILPEAPRSEETKEKAIDPNIPEIKD